ncbi:MAG: DHH family phosphoesterase [Isosphaeraceae bacterium]|nr:DHH family phosphoesterase [Isosphaeraceae bacterium]
MAAEPHETRSSILDRQTRSDRLLSALEDARRVLVITHVNPDPDALAGQLAVQHLLRHERPDLEVILTVDGMIARAENRLMVELLPIPLVPIRDVRLDRDTAVVMLDSQPGTGRHARENLVPTVVIDHHETGGNLDGVAFRDIRDNVGATCTIITGYLVERRLPVPARLATALFYGIDSEISGYPREASPLDDGAQVWLFPKTDKDLLARIRNPKLPRSHFSTFDLALSEASIHGDAVVSWAGAVDQPDIIAELSDFFIRFESVDWVLVGGICEQRLKLSMRSTPLGLHSGEILRDAVEGIGSAGGHDKRAGGSVRLVPPTLESARERFRFVRDRLFDAFEIQDRTGRPLTSRSS